jgi:thioredoxin reductase (NADPH)
MQKRAIEHPKIEILWNKTVEEFLGELRVEALSLRDVITGEVTRLPIAGVFEAIGMSLMLDFSKGR